MSIMSVGLLDSAAFAAEPASSSCSLLVAHRGEHSTWTENSLRAVTAAVDIGADYVEIDVRETKDSALILMHDRTVDRTTSGSGAVARLTVRQLRRVRLDDGSRVAMLSRVFKALQEESIQVMLEVKSIRTERGFKLLARRVRELGSERVLVTSFRPRLLDAVHVAAPEVKRSLITAQSPTLEQAVRYGSVSPHHRQITKAWLLEMRAAGYPVYAWTVNSETAWTRWNGRVDGITTDAAIEFARWRTAASCPSPQ